MIYRTHNLTGCVVVLQSKAGMHQFLKDRQRSVAVVSVPCDRCDRCENALVVHSIGDQ